MGDPGGTRPTGGLESRWGEGVEGGLELSLMDSMRVIILADPVYNSKYEKRVTTYYKQMARKKGN